MLPDSKLLGVPRYMRELFPHGDSPERGDSTEEHICFVEDMLFFWRFVGIHMPNLLPRDGVVQDDSLNAWILGGSVLIELVLNVSLYPPV